MKTKLSTIKCPYCRKFMLRMIWNNSVDVVRCDNFNCPNYRVGVPVDKDRDVIVTRFPEIYKQYDSMVVDLNKKNAD